MSDLRLLAIHAHADDETISMGGTLAVYADRGVSTEVICCTDGKLATIVAADMPEDVTRPRLAEIRQAELRAACAELGVAGVHFLEFGDSGMAGAPSNQFADAFWTANMDTAVQKVVEHIRRFRPQVVVTYDAYGGYGHPDHIQTHRVALLAVEAAHQVTMYPNAGKPWTVQKLYYTAFPRSEVARVIKFAQQAGMPSPFGAESPDDIPFATPDEFVTAKIDMREGIARKRTAMRAHRSQIGEDFPLLTIPEEVIREHFGHEHFQLAISRVGVSAPESDLFAGVTA